MQADKHLCSSQSSLSSLLWSMSLKITTFASDMITLYMELCRCDNWQLTRLDFKQPIQHNLLATILCTLLRKLILHGRSRYMQNEVGPIKFFSLLKCLETWVQSNFNFSLQSSSLFLSWFKIQMKVSFHIQRIQVFFYFKRSVSNFNLPNSKQSHCRFSNFYWDGVLL